MYRADQIVRFAFSDMSFDQEAIYFDGLYHKTINYPEPPEETHANAISDLLDKYEGPLRLSLNFYVPNQRREESRLLRRRNISGSMTSGEALGAENLQNARISASNEEVLENLLEGERLFTFSLTAIVRSPNVYDLNLRVKRLEACMNQIFHTTGFVERLAIFEGFKTASPFSATLQDSPRRITGNVLADMLPIYKANTGAGVPRSIFFTNRSTLFTHDPIDPQTPPHTYLVTGKSGSGKSVLIQSKLTDAFLSETPDYKRKKVLILDIGGPFGSSYKKWATLFGGRTYEVSATTQEFALNIFDLPKGAVLPTPHQVELNMAELEIITGDRREPFTAVERENILQSLNECYENFKGKGFILSDYRDHLNSYDEPFFKTLSQRLYSATHNSSINQLFNRQTLVDFDSPVLVFDTKNLLQDERVFQLWILAYANHIERMLLEDTETLKILVWDEFWQLAEKMKGLTELILRCGRRSRPLVFFASQSILDFANSNLAAVFANTITKAFFLQQAGNLEELNKFFPMSKEGIQVLSRLRSVKGAFSELLYVADQKPHFLKLVLSSYEYGAYTSDYGDLKRLEESGEPLQKAISRHFAQQQGGSQS